jgi:hypothetical protein
LDVSSFVVVVTAGIMAVKRFSFGVALTSPPLLPAFVSLLSTSNFVSLSRAVGTPRLTVCVCMRLCAMNPVVFTFFFFWYSLVSRVSVSQGVLTFWGEKGK